MKKIHDEIVPGMTIGEWKVIQKGEPIKGAARWECICLSCESLHLVRQAMLKNEASKRCHPCSRKKVSKKKEMIGKKFGKWTVLKHTRSHDTKNEYMYLCRCDCGTQQEMLSSSLRNKTRDHRCRSCVNRDLNKRHTYKHGMSRDRVYKVWTSMLQRCQNPNDPNYFRYGGRGIDVCKRWQSFENFIEDMGQRPRGLTIDRIDNNKGYNPENCRWVTQKQNTDNRSNSIKGLSRTRAYMSWNKMKKDCTEPNSKSFNKYGAKGIKVCQRWLDFTNFYDDMGERTSDQTLRRHDDKKDFSRENCFWGEKYKKRRTGSI